VRPVTPRAFPFRPSVSSVLATVMLTLVSTSAAAQDTTGVGAIRGVVVNAAGQPIEGARVCALDTGSCATSGARGVFGIGELRAGRYRLEILPLENLFVVDNVETPISMPSPTSLRPVAP
jgi:carboxypeptidase family protein